MKFKDLIKTLSRINNELREQAVRAVNVSPTLRIWFFGFYIVGFEQSGKDRAGYLFEDFLIFSYFSHLGLLKRNTDY